MDRKGMALVAMVIVLSSTVTVGVLCDSDNSGGADGDSSAGTDGDGSGGIHGAGGLKEAIQDLYAEIIASESASDSGVGGDSSAPRLDDVASAKAKFVSESLRRMISNIDTTDGAVVDGGGGGGDKAIEWNLRNKQKEVIDALKRYDETHGAKVGERAAKHVNQLMDKCVEMALAKNVAMDGAETTASSLAKTVTPALAKNVVMNGAETTADVKQIKNDEMGALQKCFNDLLDRFERLRMSDVTTTNGHGIYGHRALTASPLSPRPPPTTRPPPVRKPSQTKKLSQTTKPPPTTKPQSKTKPPSTTRPQLPPQRTTRLVGRYMFRQFTHKQPRVEIANTVADY